MTVALPALLTLTQSALPDFRSFALRATFRKCCSDESDDDENVSDEDEDDETCCDVIKESGVDCVFGSPEPPEQACRKAACNGDTIQDATASEAEALLLEDFEEDPQAVADFELWLQSQRKPFDGCEPAAQTRKVEVDLAEPDDGDDPDLEDFEEDPQAVADFEIWLRTQRVPSDKCDLELNAEMRDEISLAQEIEVHDYQVDPWAASMMPVGPSSFLQQVFHETAISNGVYQSYRQIEEEKFDVSAQENGSTRDGSRDDQEDDHEAFLLEDFEDYPQSVADYEKWRQDLDDQEDEYEGLLLEDFEEDPQALIDFEEWRQRQVVPSH